MTQLGALLRRYYGRDAFEWFDRSYVMDWAAIAGIWLLSQIIAWSPVYERSFDPSDPIVSLSHLRNQIGSATNHFTALLVPLAIFLVIGTLQGSLHVIHHGAIGLCASRGLARLVTEFLKHTVGRLRPDFLARCKWDSAIKACMGRAKDVVDGRKSFPSGHSSTAFSGMVFLSLWIAGQTAAWCFATSKTPRTLCSSRIAIFCLTLLPIFWAMHVAISRMQDHRHHKEDVLAGSFIGIVSALICYLMFWPNPFSSASFRFGVHGQPRWLYSHIQPPMETTEFELPQNRSEREGEV